MSNTALPKKHFGKFTENMTETPNLVREQMDSYKWLIEEGIKNVFEEFSPIADYSGKKFDLDISKFTFGKPEYDEHYAKHKRLTYKIPLRIEAKLINKTTGENKSQEIFLSDFPYMTDHGTFIINGVERVIVPQLARSYGVFFLKNEMKGAEYFGAKVIPARGAWVEIESEPDGAIYVKIDRKRKFPVTTLLKVFGLEDEKAMLKAFKGVEGAEEVIKASLENDETETTDDAYIEIYKRLRDGDLATPDNAREFVTSIFSEERYDLSKVGRYQFNHRFELPTTPKALESQVLTADDVVRIVGNIITLNNTKGATEDDIDHLGFRRVRYVGEMMQHQVRIGMSRMKRNIQDRMSTVDAETILPIQFVNPRPFQAAVMEFFSTNQLSQFMDQNNILGELEHLRTLSALGPGGLTRERAGFDVRDVHTSHYGRLCPIQTPEGQNIGLILRLAVHARLNDFGIIETPYARVKNGKVTDEVVYLNALDEEKYYIAHAATDRDKSGKFTSGLIEARKKGEPYFISPKEVDFMEVATGQAFSVATTMIPFLEHDDANRSLMGSNMQKQATPCIVPEIPYVATGIEENAARDSGRLVIADEAGTVTYADARKIVVKNTKGKEQEYSLVAFSRTNNMSVFHQRASVRAGDKVKRGQVLADTSSSVDGQIAIGQNARIAFMSWAGANYEDAIVISERLVKNSKFTSIHVEEFVAYVRDTKLGPEVTTHDIPNVSEMKLRNLDEEGVVRIGAEVRPGDILVGKVTPKGETQLTPEERLLRSIFGEKAKDVKDTSLRMEAGKRGRITGVRVFSRDNGDQLESGIIKRIHIEVAQLRNISVGDKLAGRHGNKGVISRVLPEEDMPYTKDGEPIDIILTPLGVPSRMNLGQILEMHLGLAAEEQGYQAIVPPFSGTTEEEITNELKKAGFPESGKLELYDGRTGEKFDQPIAVGNMYILKLHHMVEDKIHMRSVGPYSITTQQPLGGKAQNGGQRIGEMEVWAFLGYGAAYALREVLTIKSDDILGRSAAFDSIVRGERIRQPNVPATFNVLLRHLRGLALDINLEKDGNHDDK
ncbi:DNA-directed RNA polymerase subunit beta [bacterium]|nr:DNA-directed RNA polymerase subunit beta [bacterium]|tara:strand:+ start:5011 stop:8190 length:3180 start_codon:yes stop_codon:yes gene_type:complete